MRISLALIFLCTAFITPGAAADKSAPAYPVNSICPVSGEPIDGAITQLHEGKLIAFCCEGCRNDFKAQPAKFPLKAEKSVEPVAAPAAAPRILKNVPFLAADRKEKLDVYLPAPPVPGKRSPAVVWIHGGGWAGGTKDEARAQNICGILAGAGYVAVSIDYRLGEGAWPTNLFDCKNAVRFLRARAAEYHLDPERIAVAGGSAGGHLALMVALTAGKPEFEPVGAATPYPGISSGVRCVINMYGIANLLTRQQTDKSGQPTATRRPLGTSLKLFGAESEDSPVLRAASPITHVVKNSPPVLILHGRADTTVDFAQAEELAAVLKRTGVEHELVLLDGVGHTFHFEAWNKKPLPRDVKSLALSFLAKHLGQ